MFRRAAIFLTTLLVSASALANVSLRNGNFFVGYTDIIYSGGFEPKIERVYNSKSAYKGMFGPGWGNEFEVYLNVSADGSVVVHEYGGGAQNRFNPVAFNAQELDKAVDSIADAARATGAIGSTDQLAKYKSRLKTDAEFRTEQWEKFRTQGKLQARQLKEGTQLQSNRFSYQYITKVPDGYIRNFENGKIEKFNEAGKLVRIQDKNNNFIELTYTKDGHLEKLVDNFHRRMFFKWNSKGTLDAIEGENGKKVVYEYNGAGQLAKSTDIDGNIYTYQYDRDSNVVEIGYMDKTNMKIAYYGRDKQQNVKSVKDRDGTLTEYTYDTDASNAGHFSVGVGVKGGDGKQISSSKYEYFMKRKATGEEWTYKMVTVLDGDRTETTYNECCGLPLLIKHAGEETAFEYDTKGRVTKKSTPTDVTELAYEPKVGKVTKVVKYSKTDKKQTSWSQFQYDEKGNLIFAKNSDNKGVRLFYDGNGRVKSMVDQNKRRVDFKYNENSRPVEITDPSLGTITVSYSNTGEIKKVESTAGRKIALQVTSAFQNLLDIIRPAGVSLSF